MLIIETKIENRKRKKYCCMSSLFKYDYKKQTPTLYMVGALDCYLYYLKSF